MSSGHGSVLWQLFCLVYFLDRFSGTGDADGFCDLLGLDPIDQMGPVRYHSSGGRDSGASADIHDPSRVMPNKCGDTCVFEAECSVVSGVVRT
jgi:hypothetical protein